MAAGLLLSVYVQKLGELPNFEHDGVNMRELMVVGWKPGADAAADRKRSSIKGPFRHRHRPRREPAYRVGERVHGRRRDRRLARAVARWPINSSFW